MRKISISAMLILWVFGFVFGLQYPEFVGGKTVLKKACVETSYGTLSAISFQKMMRNTMLYGNCEKVK